jgi:hypothetical protein
MKNVKALALVTLLSVSGAVLADECCKAVCATEEVAAACNPEVCVADAACPAECKKEAKKAVVEIAQNDVVNTEVEAEVKG